jgi:hypothetical protein
MNMKTEKAIIEVSTDGLLSAYMPSNEYSFGLAGYGDTEQEAIEDFYECVSEMREIEEAEGRAFPELQFQFEHAVGYASPKMVTGCVAEDPAGYNTDEQR